MPRPPTTTRPLNPSRRLRTTPRAAWYGARARNVLQRRGRLAWAGVAAFTLVLLGYLLLPAGVLGIVNIVRPARLARSDTVQLVVREAAARRRLAAADASLAAARARRAATMAALAAPVLSPSQIARRDSLTRGAASLGALVQRAENAPLPESYRALAESEWLRDDPRLRPLADSLADISRARDELEGGATVDPVFVALTTEANRYGRAIQLLALERLAALEREIARLQEPPPINAESLEALAPDTLAAAAMLQAAVDSLAAAQRRLGTARLVNAAADTVEARERARTQLAPLPLLVAGALTIAGVLAFALALLHEMRSPRLADAAEAERLTALRVLAVARRRAIPTERTRRASDRALPSLLDPTYDAYRILAWHLTAQWPRDGIITVTGDEPLVTATVAANLAAVLANDARITLLVDADFDSEPVRRVLELPESPGLAAVLDNQRRWSEALLPVHVGRSRTLDVLPSGAGPRPLDGAESDALVAEIRRAARRHDATIVVTSLAGARRARAGDDVILCATQTRTRLATLGRGVATLIEDGARVRGVVLWEGAHPAPVRLRDPRVA